MKIYSTSRSWQVSYIDTNGVTIQKTIPQGGTLKLPPGIKLNLKLNASKDSK